MNVIRLDAIVFDAGTQVRAAIDESVVTSYAERMTAGDVFPPVVLFHDGNQYYLGDGFHRAMAAKRNGLTEIPADVQAGTRTDALWFALGANRANGQRLTETDKRHAVEIALQAWPDKSASMIADQIGCSKTYVSTIKSVSSTALHLPDRVTGRDGRSYPATSSIRQTARDRAAEMLKAGESSEEVQKATGIGRDMLHELRRSLGMSMDKTRAAVAQRRKEIRDLAERGFATRQIAATVGISESGVSDIARKEGIVIHADRVIGRTLRHDANRIVERVAMDAENLTEGTDLIVFEELDKSRLPEWLRALTTGRDHLNAFIRRLTKEQRNGEAA